MNVEAIAGILNRQYVQRRVQGKPKRFILFDMDAFFEWINTGDLADPIDVEMG